MSVLVTAGLRARWSGFLAAFAAVLVGTTLITATLLVQHSARPAVQARFAGTAALVIPLQAADPDGGTADLVPWSPTEADRLAAGLRALPGAEGAEVVVDRSFYAQPFTDGRPVADPEAAEAGHGWSGARLAPYRLLTGRAPTAADEVAVGGVPGVTPGQQLTVNLAAGRARYRVSGTVDGPGVYFTDAEAARLQPGVRAIGLLGPAAAELMPRARALVDGLGTVVTGDGRAALQPALVDHRRFLGQQLITAMAGLGLFTTVFVVASALALTTGQRRRELGLLRLLGASPRQVRRLVLGEAAAVGLLGSLAGAAAGCGLAPLLGRILLGLEAAPPDLRIRLAAWPPLTATAVGVGVSVFAAWAAARRASRVRPMAALSAGPAGGRSARRTRLATGLPVLALGVLLAVRTATAAADDRVNAAIAATMTLVVAAALLSPVLTGPLGRAVSAPLRRSAWAGPLLLRAELRAVPGRAGATAAPVIAAVGFAILLGGAVQTMAAAYPAGAARQLAGQAVVTADGTPGLTDEVARAHPVGKAALPTRAFVRRADGARVVVDLLGSRDPAWDRPGEAVLGASLARELGVREGDAYPVRFADGATVELRISRVLPDDPARGAFVTSRQLVRAHDPGALGDDLFVPGDGHPIATVPGTAVHDAERFALDDYRTDARLTDALAAMLLVITVGYAGLAVANATAADAHARRQDLAVLRSAGATVRQLLGFAAGEAALLTALGAALGLAASLPPLAGLAAGLAEATGTPVSWQLDLPALGATLLGILAVAIGTRLLTTWRTAR
ncbi:FtsX-like permease family protein [Kitasatospora sp. NPDC096147]|uniref:FtsX-like permease family protein n=1 Tax=Kitasatospora sp. NPDC096147 TaxID=3364093 RepID=UPI0038201535